MSNTRSPFLSEENVNQENNTPTEVKSSVPITPVSEGITPTSIPPKVIESEVKSSYYNSGDAGMGNSNENLKEIKKEEAVLEIGGKSNGSRMVIMVLGGLVILGILGLLAYNFFYSKDTQPIQQESSGDSIESTTFEMTGGEFNATSVVID